MSDRYIIISDGGSPVQCLTERQALQTAAELFDRYGPDTEIEIYLNELLAESILCTPGRGCGSGTAADFGHS